MVRKAGTWILPRGSLDRGGEERGNLQALQLEDVQLQETSLQRRQRKNRLGGAGKLGQADSRRADGRMS